MDTIDTTIAIPAELNQHSRVVVSMWLKYAAAAEAKSDYAEAHRLRQLARRKISEEMSRQRCGEED